MKAAFLASSLSLALGSVLAAPSTIQARDDVTPVSVKGNAFFKGDERFYVRGVDYQPGGSGDLADPLADTEGCKRDIEKFTSLGLNTIRVYSVDNSKNHDECMNALADAGIYVVVDVNTPKYSLNRKDPKASYNDVYLQFIFATADMFAQYKNTLAFFSGNEVVNDGPSSKTAPYVKAVTRDLRQYLRERKLRTVPVGYSAADIDTNRLQMAEYMNCGTDDERSDFFAFNDYSWCDPSSFTTSGWDKKVEMFSGYGLPLFLSEYGCNTNKRDFEEVEALYSDKMTSVYSGGLVYEYSQEDSDYGLVKVSGDELKELSDFSALQSAFKKTANSEGDGGYNKTGGASTCPKQEKPAWDVPNDSLPAIPEPAKKYFKDGAGKGKGFSGSGSQSAGTSSTGTAEPGSASVDGSDYSGSGSASSASGSSSSSKGAAAGLHVPSLSMAPIAVGMVTILSTLFGAGLILV